ncbi:MAG TPA: hypothetical protein PLP48_07565 [Acholeplasmataceae bacterium]|nr:hypothetical protein [Acholeplasmataceae bacterium]
MTNKQLKKYIKKQAMAVEVKDFSSRILERINQEPHLQEEVVITKKHLWNLKPILISTLALMTVIIMIFAFYPDPVVPTPTEGVVLENLETVVALSSVQTTSLINVLDTDLNQTSSYTLLRFGPMERNDKIRDELADLSRYLETIEKLYSSNTDFDVVDEEVQTNGYARRMRFRTRDLMNEEDDYEIQYNQTINQTTKAFMIQGQIRIGEREYEMEAEGIVGQKGLLMRAQKDEFNYVILNYHEEDDRYTFEVELIQNNISIEKVTITLVMEDDTRVATLSFIEGESTGTYTFRILTEDNQRIISIHYAIDFDGELEEGDITIRLLQLPSSTIYSIVIKPEGRVPFTITRGRVITGRGMNPMGMI